MTELPGRPMTQPDRVLGAEKPNSPKKATNIKDFTLLSIKEFRMLSLVQYCAHDVFVGDSAQLLPSQIDRRLC